MMHINKIKLENVRCFDNVTIDLSHDNLCSSVLIAGNNGTGKSALLRAISMGLCDRDSAAALLRELSGNFVKLKENKDKLNEAVINIELSYQGEDQKELIFQVETKITEYPGIIGETVAQRIVIPHINEAFNIPEGISNIIDKCTDKVSGVVDKKGIEQYIPWINTFVTGYGPGLRTTGTAKFSDYFAPDALYSIFNYSTPLQDPEIAWRRIVAASKKYSENLGEKKSQQIANETSNKISKLIHGILGFESNEEVVLEPNGIFVRDDAMKNGDLIELDAKGDGHKSLVKVFLDILIWYLLFNNYDENKQGEERDWHPLEIDDREGKIVVPDVQGIVIMDEIEQHLHPKLQRKIIKNLSEKLPNVQFIISTHSPLCLSGTSDISASENRGYKIYSIFKDKNKYQVKEKDLPTGLRADQILVDYFELNTTINIALQKKVDRLRELYENEDRSPSEEAEYKTLNEELQSSAPLVAEGEEDRRREMKRDKITEELMSMLKKQGKFKND